MGGLFTRLFSSPKRPTLSRKETGPQSIGLLSLPDVFIRDVMKRIYIQDRMRMRLVCRAFEKLVAETHAGYFDCASINRSPHNAKEGVTIRITQMEVQEFDCDIPCYDEVSITLPQQSNRLFAGISFGNVGVYLNKTCVERLHKFLERCSKIKELHFYSIETEEDFMNALGIMSDFPTSQFTMHLAYTPFPLPDQLLLLPPMKKLSAEGFGTAAREAWLINGTLFLELLTKHENMFLYNVMLSPEEWTRTLQIISADSRKRTVKLYVPLLKIVEWLYHCGITSLSEAGSIREEVTMDEPLGRGKEYGMVKLRYRKCWITLGKFRWACYDYQARVYMTNCDGYLW